MTPHLMLRNSGVIFTKNRATARIGVLRTPTARVDNHLKRQAFGVIPAKNMATPQTLVMPTLPAQMKKAKERRSTARAKEKREASATGTGKARIFQLRTAPTKPRLHCMTNHPIQPHQPYHGGTKTNSDPPALQQDIQDI